MVQSLFLDNQIENVSHRVFISAMDTLDPKLVLEKLNIVSGITKCALRPNLAIGLVVKTLEYASYQF